MTTIIPYRRYNGVARQLIKLPRELVYPILSDLSLIKILELICRHELPYIDECILGHLDLRKLFKSKEDLTTVKGYFKVFLMLWDGGAQEYTMTLPILKVDTITFMKDGHLGFDDIVRELRSAISGITIHNYGPYVYLLGHYSDPDAYIPLSDDWDAQTPEIAFEVVDAFRRAEANLNKVKSRQLDKLADLLVEFPGTMRTRGDVPTQVKRRNEAHLIERLRLCSRRMSTSKILRKDFVALTVFVFSDCYLVPYDRLLQGFLKVISKYPHEPTATTFNYYRYPQEMDVTMRGIEFIYERKPFHLDPIQPTHRTLYTPYGPKGSKRARGVNRPTFVSTDMSQRRYKDVEYLSSEVKREILPFAEEELEWLECFLRTCRYMSKEMGHVQWKGGQSVSEFWQSYVGPV